MKGATKTISNALAKTISDNLNIATEDSKALEALEFIKNIISPQLPEDNIEDPVEFVDFLRAQSAVQYRVSVNLYFSEYMLCYNPVTITAELATQDGMFSIGDIIYRWQLLRDYDGNRFAGVSDFILWLSGEIGSSRATVWRKVSLIRNLLGLGITIEDAYSIFSLGSFSVSKVLSTVGTFTEGKLIEISPVIAERFIHDTALVNGERGTYLKTLWEKSNDDMVSYSIFNSEILPYIRHMVEDWTNFEEASELRQWEDTVLVDPEYTFRVKNDSLIIKITYYKYNVEEDKKYVEKTVEEILIPTSRADGILSDEIIIALDKHLPLRRRTEP